MKTIIIGCGETVEKGYGDDVKKTNGPWYPYRFHCHKNCTTIDINPLCNPDIVLDFSLAELWEIQFKLKNQKFDLVILENLPANIFYANNILYKIIRNACFVCSEAGKVFIPRTVNDLVVESEFFKFGFKTTYKGRDLSLIWKIISSFVGEYAEEYILNNYTKNAIILNTLGREVLPALLLKRQ